MAIDNYDNHMMLVNLSNGVSNEDWTDMIEEIYNNDEEMEIEPEVIVDSAEAVNLNPKAKDLRLSKNCFKTFQAEQKKDYEKLI